MTNPLMTLDAELRYMRNLWPKSDQPIPADLFLTAHSLECDDIPGIAWQLNIGWLQEESEESSVHTLTDSGPAGGDKGETVQGMEYANVAWHCGGGNQHGSGHEIVGRASWTADQWGTASMDRAFRSLAHVLARKWVYRTMPKLGITYYPEWLSLAQIAAQDTAGLVTHNDMRLVFGGTTHTDPGPNYPYQKLRDYIHAEMDTLLGKTPGDDMSQQDKDNIAANTAAIAALKSSLSSNTLTLGNAVKALQATAASHAGKLAALDGLTRRLANAQGPLEAGYNKLRVALAATNAVVNALKARVK